MVSGLRFLGAFSALAPPQAHAKNGYFTDGLDTQSKSEAGVAYALPTDALSIATNPASASFVGNRVDFDVDFFAPQRSASITGNAYGPDQDFSGNKIKLFIVPEAGVVYQFPHNLSFGLAVYSYGGIGLFSGFSQDPQNFNHGGEDSTAGVGVRVGYYGQLAPWLAVGAA